MPLCFTPGMPVARHYAANIFRLEHVATAVRHVTFTTSHLAAAAASGAAAASVKACETSEFDIPASVRASSWYPGALPARRVRQPTAPLHPHAAQERAAGMVTGLHSPLP